MIFTPERTAGALFTASRHLTIATVAVATVSLSTLGAQAAGLFEPASAAESAAHASASAAPTTIRDRLVQLDYDYMEANLVPLDVDNSKDRVRIAPDAGPIDVELFPDVSLTLGRKSLEKARGASGGFIWSGNATDDPGGYAVLVISDGHMTGQILAGNRLFTIEPVEGAVHRVTEVDQSKFPPEQFVLSPDNGNDAGNDATSPEGLSSPLRKSKVRVLIPYTKSAKKEAGDIKQSASLAIKLANDSTKNGGAKIKYQLAGTMQVKYKEKTFEKDLDKLRKGKKKFKAVHKQRNKKKADLVAMLRKADSLYCGLGYLNKDPVPSDEQYGFTVTAVGCITNHSVAHEMGHNSGLEHDRFVLTYTPSSSEYNYGYVNTTDQVRSVMAYANKCSTCTRVPMFSSTTKMWNGTDMLGVAPPSADAADASRTLNNNRKVISKFR